MHIIGEEALSARALSLFSSIIINFHEGYPMRFNPIHVCVCWMRSQVENDRFPPCVRFLIFSIHIWSLFQGGFSSCPIQWALEFCQLQRYLLFMFSWPMMTVQTIQQPQLQTFPQPATTLDFVPLPLAATSFTHNLIIRLITLNLLPPITLITIIPLLIITIPIITIKIIPLTIIIIVLLTTASLHALICVIIKFDLKFSILSIFISFFLQLLLHLLNIPTFTQSQNYRIFSYSSIEEKTTGTHYQNHRFFSFPTWNLEPELQSNSVHFQTQLIFITQQGYPIYFCSALARQIYEFMIVFAYSTFQHSKTNFLPLTNFFI